MLIETASSNFGERCHVSDVSDHPGHHAFAAALVDFHGAAHLDRHHGVGCLAHAHASLGSRCRSTGCFEMYPLVNKHSYGKWQFIVGFPLENGDFL